MVQINPPHNKNHTFNNTLCFPYYNYSENNTLKKMTKRQKGISFLTFGQVYLPLGNV